MNNILQKLQEPQTVKSSDSIPIIHNNVLSQTSELNFGDQVSIKDVKTSGIYIGSITIDGTETKLFAIGGSFNDIIIELNQTVYTYDGNYKKPSVTVKDTLGNIIDSDKYTVTYYNNKNAGNASVEVIAKDDSGYIGSKTVSFTIKKATMTGITAPNVSGNSTNGAKITVSGYPSGSTVYYGTTTSYSSGTTNPTIKTVGDTPVYFKITNSNYNDYTGSAKVTITQAEITGGIWNCNPASSWGNIDAAYDSNTGQWYGEGNNANLTVTKQNGKFHGVLKLMWYGWYTYTGDSTSLTSESFTISGAGRSFTASWKAS